MKGMISAALVALFIATGTAYPEDSAIPPNMLEMMKKMGGPKPDERRVLDLPAQMKVMQKRMMIRHLDTVGEVTAALASGDLQGAAAMTRERLGWSEEEEKRCSMVEKLTGEEEFTSLGRAVHLKADELAAAADEGKKDEALARLADLISNCNDCHRVFRH